MNRPPTFYTHVQNYLLRCMESSGGAEKLKKDTYTCSGEEKEKNTKRNYTFYCHTMKIKSAQQSVNHDFSKNG